LLRVYLFFFFQAEDGIRDSSVTGVQTCALPIYSRGNPTVEADVHVGAGARARARAGQGGGAGAGNGVRGRATVPSGASTGEHEEIGRASCRERVEGSVVAEGLRGKVGGSGAECE